MLVPAGSTWRTLLSRQTGVASLRDHREVEFVGERQDAAHLVRRAGAQHKCRAADVFVAQLAQVRQLRVGIDKSVALADDRGEALDGLGRKCARGARGHLVHI
jgi:hypothetical protein